MKIIALILARSGSKSIADKNIQLLAGKPMMALSIEHDLASRYIDRVIVNTDSEKYRQIALSFGAEAHFLREAEYSQDLSLDMMFLNMP